MSSSDIAIAPIVETLGHFHEREEARRKSPETPPLHARRDDPFPHASILKVGHNLESTPGSRKLDVSAPLISTVGGRRALGAEALQPAI